MKERKQNVNMKERKLNYKIHNPNPQEAMAEALSRVFVEAGKRN